MKMKHLMVAVCIGVTLLMTGCPKTTEVKTIGEGAVEPEQECPDGQLVYEGTPEERCIEGDSYCSGQFQRGFQFKFGDQPTHRAAAIFCKNLDLIRHGMYKSCQIYPLTPNRSGPQRVFWCEPETPEPEATLTPEVPQCVRLYLHQKGYQFWRAIKTPIPEGAENPRNPSQKYNYKVCGDRPVGMRPPSSNHPGTRKCDITGGLVMAYKNGGFFSHAIEVDEHCIDDPIDGACKETNCGWFFERFPYPPTCTVPETQALGTCIAMWNI